MVHYTIGYKTTTIHIYQRSIENSKNLQIKPMQLDNKNTPIPNPRFTNISKTGVWGKNRL